MLEKKKILFTCLIFILAFYSCTGLRHIPESEVLYTGAKFKINSDTAVDKKNIRKELDRLTRPRPNQVILGIRPKLWLYNLGGENPKRGIRKWLKTKAGEKPVYLSSVNPDVTAELMMNRLNSLGYFNAIVKYKLVKSKNTAYIEYTARVSAPYKLKSIIYLIDNAALNFPINSMAKGTYLKPGDQYNLDKIIQERIRIDLGLKNLGFYFFKADYLLYKADTTAGNRSVILKVTLKPDIPDKGKTRYVLNDIIINPSYRRNRDSVRLKMDTIRVGEYIYLNRDSAFKPETIIRAVYLKKGENYSRKNHNLTISRLMSMGVFRYATIIFKDTIINHEGILDATINLTPLKPKSLQVEFEAVTKSNNFTGPAINLSYKNRNLFRGAELLVLNLNSSFETQFTGKQKGFFSFEYGASSQLYFPKFLLPFKVRESSFFIPKTKIDLGFRVLHRVEYFNMNALNFSFGYNWKEDAQKEWEINPISINFAKLTSTTEAFDLLLKKNSYLRKSFEEQFTIGAKCSYTFNSMIGLERRSSFYFNAGLDLSGNSIYFIQSLFSSYRSTEAHPYKLFGYRYSQYSKISTDTRYYYNFDKNNKMASRVIVGVGAPYGNSSTLPYIKQFFSGGSNSLRAFLPRSIGPGTYKLPDTGSAKVLLNQSGDIKLEGNLEYRFTIVSILKGAFFADAGNVWLIRKNADLPGGEFNFKTFKDELAVGTGFGLRLDLSFFVLRFDLGIPIRKPYLPKQERWVLDKIDFNDPSWRNDNLVLNIAIGYPF
jgi:outer membrane protein assembly factor BamA